MTFLSKPDVCLCKNKNTFLSSYIFVGALGSDLFLRQNMVACSRMLESAWFVT